MSLLADIQGAFFRWFTPNMKLSRPSEDRCFAAGYRAGRKAERVRVAKSRAAVIAAEQTSQLLQRQLLREIGADAEKQ